MRFHNILKINNLILKYLYYDKIIYEVLTMNFLYYLLPKEKIAFLNQNQTLRQAMEKMEYHRYTAVPIINDEGKYVGVIREGDILWYIKNLKSFDFKLTEQIIIKDVPRISDHESITINAEIDEIIDLAIEQNFIPVVDDLGTFIGIVTRKSIITEQFKMKRGK